MMLHVTGNMAGSFMIVERFVEILEKLTTTKYVYFNMFNWFGNLLNLALAVLSIIGMWRMFTKAGEPEWGAIVPFYNRYLLFKISDMKHWFWAELVLSITYGVSICAFVVCIIGVLIASFSTVDYNKALNGTGISFVIMIITGVLLFVLHIVRSILLARNFHLGGGWVLGFLFLPGVFYMIVGCSGKIRYKDRLVSGLLPGQIPEGPAQGAYGYSQGQQTYDSYGAQNNAYNTAYGAPVNPYAQNNPYAQGNPYTQNNAFNSQAQGNPYAQSDAFNSQAQGNPYAQSDAFNSQAQGNPYAQNNAFNSQAQGNPYAQSNAYNPQPQYGQNVNVQNPVQNPPPQAPADQATPLQNAAPVQNAAPLQSAAPVQNAAAQGEVPPSNGVRDEAVWKTIYDDSANNIK